MRKNKFIQRKQQSMKNIMILLILIIGLGYALLSQNLNINGITSMANATWDIHWENVQVKEGSVEANTPVIDSAKTTVTYAVVLNTPGDFYEFTVDAVNAGTIDGMIESITSKLNGATITTLPDYLEYTVSYSDDVPLAANHLLAAGDTETYKVRIKYKDDIEINQIPATDQTLSLEFTVKYKQVDDNAVSSHPYLYDVLKDAATEGKYAKEYTGEHQDSMAGVGTKKIYHWYAPNNTAGNALATEILDKNNVIFANHCWQMIRTTDTGGVKIIYNGAVENGQCLSSRGNHDGYASNGSQTMSPTYYYGTSYTYDKDNNVFRLDGTVTTGAIKVGEYTCKSTSQTCDQLYYTYSGGYHDIYSVLIIKNNSHFTEIGKLPINYPDWSPERIGYMYGDSYELYRRELSYSILTSSYTLDTNWKYSDAIDYGNINEDNYTLINSQSISSLDDYSELIGKYTLFSDANVGAKARYILAVNGTTIYYRELSKGDLAISMMIGDTYIDNGDGTYTIENPINVSYIDWYNGSYSNYAYKYVCVGTNDTCSELRHIKATVQRNYYFYWSTKHRYKYGENVSYDGEKYTLTGDIVEFWDIVKSENVSKISSHHYTCFNTETSCDNVNYITYYYSQDPSLYFARLGGHNDITSLLNDMLFDSNINRNSSIIKYGIEGWYKKNLSEYTSKLEDTIFCYDRSIKSLNGWNPSGGNIMEALTFNNYTKNRNLSCQYITDKFSVTNSKAASTYPIGLLSYPEKSILENQNILKTGQSYWLGSPHNFMYYYADVKQVASNGSDSYSAVRYAGGIRPVISLKPRTIYSSGDGSKNNPYIVQ